jgi:hypothetical protein
MTEIEDYASSLYGETEENGANEWSADDSLLGGRQSKDERPGQEFQPDVIPFKQIPVDPVEALNSADGEGDPPITYDPNLDALFDGHEKEARINHDHQQLSALASGRKGIEAILKQHAVGGSAAQSLMLTAKDFIESPRSPEQIAAANIVTSKALKAKWGGDYDKMLSGAKRVLSDAARKVPGLMDTFNNTGLGSDEKTIILLANAARRKGYVK